MMYYGKVKSEVSDSFALPCKNLYAANRDGNGTIDSFMLPREE